MQTTYEEYWHQAMELRHQTEDMIADHDHPLARSLHHETVQLVWQFPQHAQRLGAERLVYLPHVDLLGLESRPADRGRDRPCRGHAHDERVDAIDRTRYHSG